VAVVVVAVVAAVTLKVGHHKPNGSTKPTRIDGQTKAVWPSPTAALAPPALDKQSTSQSSTAAALAPTTATALASSDPAAALRQQVATAYLAFERTLNQQLAVIAPDTIPLQNVATGQVLASSQSAVAELRGKGEVQRGDPIFTDVVVTLHPSSTTAEVCATEDDSPATIVVAKTGAVVASGFPRYKALTTMVLDRGNWKASTASSTAAC
jgi:hypothetical protein